MMHFNVRELYFLAVDHVHDETIEDRIAKEFQALKARCPAVTRRMRHCFDKENLLLEGVTNQLLKRLKKWRQNNISRGLVKHSCPPILERLPVYLRKKDAHAGQGFGHATIELRRSK